MGKFPKNLEKFSISSVGDLYMDRLDCRILDALQEDGSLTQAELAKLVASTPSTCLRRTQRLKDAKFLKRNVYLADPVRLERGLKAFISVVTRGHGQKNLPKLAAKADAEPAISLAYGTSGENDAILVGNFASMEEYREVCRRLLDDDSRVVRYSTFFVVETYKESTVVSTDALQAKVDR